jgi:hypothetical protein
MNRFGHTARKTSMEVEMLVIGGTRTHPGSGMLVVYNITFRQ